MYRVFFVTTDKHVFAERQKEYFGYLENLSNCKLLTLVDNKEEGNSELKVFKRQVFRNDSLSTNQSSNSLTHRLCDTESHCLNINAKTKYSNTNYLTTHYLLPIYLPTYLSTRYLHTCQLTYLFIFLSTYRLLISGHYQV